MPENWIEALPEGHQGTIRTLETMRALARKDYQSIYVRSVVAGILHGSPGDPVKALFEFARDQIRYLPDPPGLERVQDFQRSTESRAGDCDDKATWLATALLSIDIPVRFVCQSYGGDTWANGWDHVYLQFYDFQKWRWVALDPTADGHQGVPVAGVGWLQLLGPGGHEMNYEV